MKKAFSYILGLYCILSCVAFPTFAIDISDGEPGETLVRYSVSSTYTVTIPASITFTALDQVQSAAISASNVLLDTGRSLVVNMISQNGRLQYGDDSYVGYQFKVNDGTATEIEKDANYGVMNVAQTTASASVNLKFESLSSKSNVAYAGNHIDNLTFVSEVRGAGATYMMLRTTPKISDSPASMVFRSEADLDTFQRIELDGETVSAGNYKLESGSTLVTFAKPYEMSLANGTHTVRIVSDGGYAEADFVKDGTKHDVIHFTINSSVYGVPTRTYTALKGANWASWVLSYGMSSSSNGIVWFGFDSPASVYLDNTNEAQSPHVNKIMDANYNYQHVGDYIVDGMTYLVGGPV